MRSVKFRRRLMCIFLMIFILVTMIPLVHSYDVGEKIFNGGDDGLKDKTFERGTSHWSVSSGSGEIYNNGRIGKCLKIKSSSSSVIMSQTLSGQELKFARNRKLAFFAFFKGTQDGDIARARIKYKCNFRFMYWRWTVTRIEYGDFMEKSKDALQPWTLTTVEFNIPYYCTEITVELEIKNKNGKSVTAYVDDAEIAIFAYTKESEDFTYYSYHRNEDKTMDINYGISAAIYEQEVLSGDHSQHQMTLGLSAFGASTDGYLEKIKLRIEMWPKKFHEGVPIWPFDDYHYTSQEGDLNVLSLSQFNNNPFSASGDSSAVHDLAFLPMTFSFRMLGSAITSAVITTANPVLAVASRVLAGWTVAVISDNLANPITDFLYGVDQPVTSKMDANGGKDYYTETTWNLKTSFYQNNRRIDTVPSIALAENFLQWTYKTNQDCFIRITATFYWGHYDLDRYSNTFYVYDGKTSISMDLEV